MKNGFSLVELSIVLLKQILSLRGALATKQSMDCRTQASPSFAMTGGFSLVELSIVLVILGLLTGGILTGQNLIRNAELRSVSTQIAQFQTSVYTFRDRYFALPGDMTNATDFWGAADSGDGEGADCFTVESSTSATCNGNSDGQIQTPTGGTGAWLYGERYHAWKQLANAGLIEGDYTGRTDSTTDENVNTTDKNVPKSKLSGGHFTIFYQESTGVNWFPAAYYKNLLRIDLTSGPPFTPEEAWNIDTKLDDGKPGYGWVVGYTGPPTGTWNPNCVSSDNAATAEYELAATARLCPLNFLFK